MNKEREALLKAILAEPDTPHKVSEKSIQLTPEKANAFDEAYLQCLLNDVGISEPIDKRFIHETLITSI